ncbi:MAG: Ig-like domain-containing protein [Rubripirellula sp.]
MIKRSESKSKKSPRKRSDRKSRRRLMMEGLEQRQLLAGDILLPNVPSGFAQFSGPRNVGTVQAASFIESETTTESGLNDFFGDADLVPLGTGPGQQNTIDVTGSMLFTAFPNDPTRFDVDIDTFALDLRAGDILDIATLGTAGTVDLSYSNGTQWFSTDTPQAGFYPADSPLQTLGNVTIAHVVPEDGRYYLSVSPIDTTGNYTLGLRAYRPVAEQLPIGGQQVIFLDFDGGRLPNSSLGGLTVGLQRYPSLAESLPLLGIDQFDVAAENQLIDRILEEVTFHFDTIGLKGGNGDYNRSGIAGEYGFTLLNSRDHADPGNHPLVTRVLVGGDSTIPGLPVNGFSTTLDVGNFSMDDVVVTVLDGVFAEAQLFPISTRESLLTATAVRVSSTISHEAAHSFGLRHTLNTNNVGSIIDSGGSLVVVGQRLGVGPDGIFGTLDDERIEFRDDRFAPEGIFGVNRVVNALSYSLATGTVGSSVTGIVFDDANRDGSGSGDSGIAGVTVFADTNGNGVQDPSEPGTVTSATGAFALSVAPGTVNVVAITPTDFAATTPVVVSSGNPGGVQFGFSQVNANITGTTYVDSNGNGIRDIGDRGLEGVFIYVDLDQDNRPDLGEPQAVSDLNGSYSLNFPGAGNYTIRQVTPAGFEQTFPANGEHNVFFNGISLSDNFDFGLLPSQDFGDAPDTYGTTLAANGASHGIITGLQIGSTVDREIDGQPNVAANGDDLNGDDEDGVRLLSPLGPGDTATFEVTVTNTSGGDAFLQAFLDFNRDGDFDDAGEQFRTDLVVPNGTSNSVIPVEVSVPAGASVGTTYARFRLSQTGGLSATGFATTGEVEDHSFPILNAAEIANADEFTISRNTLSNQLDVLANDFQTFDNQLVIDSLNTTGTEGIVVRSSDQKTLFYTPPSGFIGRDVFSYTVVDQFGNRSTAPVVVNVSFQTNVPIALDDTFDVPQNSVNRALNVLDNDIVSLFGGLTITSVTSGSEGGTVNVVGGGQSLRYTPIAGFNGTEQFTYSLQDAAGSVSSATVTVNLLPGSRNDDVVDFSIGIFDPVNINTPISNVQVGDDFLVRVSVDDIRAIANPEGVASAFLDLLYTDELVSTLNTDNNPDFPFDISFGGLFSGGSVLQRGNADTPGLVDEVGGVQSITNQQSHSGPVELFTLRMRAVSPGVAVFAADPADGVVSETTVLASDTALTPSQLRLGRSELLILPASGNFASAIDDSFPQGFDSNGNAISSTSANRAVLDVLANDNKGPTGTIREFGLVTNPTLGNVFIDDSGTPGDLNDDFISYRPNAGANGLERFTYVTVTDDNIRSTAEVTIALGNQNAVSDVAFDFALVGSDGTTPIGNSISVGDRFGVQVFAEDLRGNGTFVFAGFLDVLYSSGVIQPSDTNQSDSFDFDVIFGSSFLSDPDTDSTAARPGIIDEFGSLRRSTSTNGANPDLLATLFFDAVAPGTASVVGSPADSSPFQDTLLFREDDPVDVSLIRYDQISITVGGGAPLQNTSFRQDVNNDGFVSPVDALLIINEMSRIDTIEGEEGSFVASRYFHDVNGDDNISGIDALQVINYLNRASNVATRSEGELVAPLASNAAVEGTDQADAVFAGLEQNARKIVSTDISGAPLVSPLEIASDDTSEEDEDILDVLAGDISGLQS